VDKALSKDKAIKKLSFISFFLLQNHLQGAFPMATIQINNLQPNGFDLFDDRESYLKELNDAELNLTNGEGTPVAIATAVAVVTLVGSVAYYLFKPANPPVGAGNDPIVHKINERNAQIDELLP
jgi:hypothetical protein